MKNIVLNSLRIKIIRNMSVIIILFFGTFQSYKYFELKNNLEADLSARADRIIQRLVNELEGPLWDLDEDLVQVMIDSESKVDYVHAIYVSGDSNVALSLDKDDSGFEHDISDYVYRSSKIFYNGIEVGNVKLFLTLKLINKRLENELNSAIVSGTTQIILIVFLLWIMLNKTILTPIGALVQSTRLIAEGKYSNVDLNLGNDELGLLGKSIQKMNDKISSRENEILDSAKRLEEVTERLEQALSGTKDGLWDWNIESDTIYFSPGWKGMIGYKDDELTNDFDNWKKNVHPDDIEEVYENITSSHNSLEGVFSSTHRLKHKNGSWVWILARGKTIFNEAGEAIRMVGFHTDITKQKNLELELHQQEELIIAQSRHVAMGEMISMIAHQWRQPITVIAMGANNMLADIALEQVTTEKFEGVAHDILKQTKYLSKTIDDFKNFFRPNKDKDVINVCAVLDEAKELMGTNITNSNIKLIFTDRIDETINTYSRELLQVILNFLKNSKEVLEEKSIENAYIKMSVKSIEDCIVISVCDNGGGVDDDIKARIFDPYFSTKGPSVGTGLGLYMSKIIVEKHLLGRIDIVDTDDGVCFEIVLNKDVKENK